MPFDGNLLDEPVLRQLPQVVAGRTRVGGEAPSQLGRGRRPVLAQYGEHPHPQRMGQRLQFLAVVHFSLAHAATLDLAE
jgi:hypothetical protein